MSSCHQRVNFPYLWQDPGQATLARHPNAFRYTCPLSPVLSWDAARNSLLPPRDKERNGTPGSVRVRDAMISYFGGNAGSFTIQTPLRPKSLAFAFLSCSPVPQQTLRRPAYDSSAETDGTTWTPMPSPPSCCGGGLSCVRSRPSRHVFSEHARRSLACRHPVGIVHRSRKVVVRAPRLPSPGTQQLDEITQPPTSWCRR
jgi:hypothetical protein